MDFPIPRLRYPTELTIEPIQLCNARCFTCPYPRLAEDPEYTKQRMPREKIAALLTEFGELMRRHHYRGPSVVLPFRYSDPLIGPDLDVFLQKAREYGFGIRLTTNSVSFDTEKIALLESYADEILPYISISILGSNKDEVSEQMGIDLDRTIRLLTRVARTSPVLTSKIRISMRRIKDTPEESANLAELKTLFDDLGFATDVRKAGWIHNRIGGNTDAGMGAVDVQQTPEKFLDGCGQYRNKIARRMEIMVNGDVVLCCDDAERHRVYGNVFETSIEEVWNGALLEEHRRIYARRFRPDKQDLICTSCSRAVYGRPLNYGNRSLKALGGASHVLVQTLRGNVSAV